jgi:nucleotide-binding universal stress UspA family protein
MAEQWQAQLVALVAAGNEADQTTVEAYLELHELPAPVMTTQGGWWTLAPEAARRESDLVVLGFPGHDVREELQLPALQELLRACDRPLLVCA